MADYASLSAQIPGLANAGATIATQLTSEGATAGLSASQVADNIGAAHAQLADTFDNLVNSGGGFQLPIDGTGGAIDIASQAVVAARTTVGAVQGVVGLLNAASSATPAEVVAAGNVIVGTIIAAAVSAGAFSAGVGAVVVAGVALAGEALSALFGGSPPAAVVCGSSLNTVPTIIVGCAFSTTAQPIAPGSPYWRHFPEPNQATDAGWFASGTSSGLGDYFSAVRWQPAPSGPTDTWFAAWTTAPRLIDVAFSDYAQIAGEQEPVGVGSVISDFKAAFFTAWKANRAFALNGLKTQADYAVLFQTVRAWNAAHAPGDGGGLLVAPYNSSAGMTYEAGLIEQIVALSGGDSNIVRGNLLIHTGALLTPPKTIHLRLPGALATSSNATVGSIVKTVAVGTAIIGVVGAAGVGAYALLTHQTFFGVLHSIWGSTGARLVAHVNPLPKKRRKTRRSRRRRA